MSLIGGHDYSTWKLGCDKTFCHVCMKAYTEKTLSATYLKPTFIVTGYKNWKDSTVSIAIHERSKCHAVTLFMTVEVQSLCMISGKVCHLN